MKTTTLMLCTTSIVLSIACMGCRDEGPGDGDGGPDTYSSCPQIESAYVRTLDDEVSTRCASNSECFLFDGLCNPTDGRAEGTRGLSTSVEEEIRAMEAGWDELDCEDDVRCNSSMDELAYCVDSSCVDSFDCDRTLGELCREATLDCGLFDGSSVTCSDELWDRLVCDPDVADPTEASTCLSGATLDCASVDDFLASAFTACDQHLGLSQP
jgi:hypothetical protein